MAVVTYLLRADLRRRWRSLAMLALLIAIVVGAVLTATAGARRTRTSFDRYIEQVRPFDAVATFEDEPPDRGAVEQIDGVEAAIDFTWPAVFPSGGPDGFYFIPLWVPGDPRVPDTYQRAPVVDGRAPDPSEPLEIALSERTARRLGVGVGDPLPALSFSAAQVALGDDTEPEGPALEFDVVGIIRTPGDVTAREGDIEPNLLTPAFAETYDGEIGRFGAGLLLALEPGASAEAVAREMVVAAPDVTFETSFGPEVYRDQAEPTLAAMATGLQVVALIVALAGGVVIVQALNRAASDRLADHQGVRALGGTRAAQLMQLSLPSALAAAVGMIAGAVLSIVVSPFVLWGLARTAEPDGGAHVDLPVLALGVISATVLLAMAVTLIAHLTIRRSEQPAGSGRTSGVVSRAAGLGASVAAVAGLRLALERGRGERATPVGTAAVAAALGGIGVMATVVFASSLHHAVTTPSVYGWEIDGVLVGSDNGDDLGENVALGSAIAADPAFAAVTEVVNDLEITVDGAPNRAWVLDDLSGHSTFVMTRGREPRGPAEVAVGGQTLAQLGVGLGDTVEVSTGGPTQTLEIVGEAMLPVTVDGGSSALGLAMRREAAEAVGFSGHCEADDECSRYLGVTAAPGTTIVAAVAPHLSDDVSLVTPTPPAEIERLRAIDGLPRALAAVLGVIAVLAVTHAAAVTVRRRRRDLAVLKVLGLYGRQLRHVVTVQVAVLALGGAVVGVVLGVALGRVLWGAVADSVPLPVVIAFPVAGVVAVPLAIAALAELGASLSRRSAGRLRAGIALRAE